MSSLMLNKYGVNLDFSYWALIRESIFPMHIITLCVKYKHEKVIYLIIIIIVLRVCAVSIWVVAVQAHTYLQKLISICDGRLLFLEAFLNRLTSLVL